MNIIKRWALPLLFTSIFILGFSIMSAAFDCPGVDAKLYPKDYQKLTVSSTSVPLTVPQVAEVAVVHVETNPVRYRDDGTDPTSNDGPKVSEGGAIVVCEGSLRDIEFIATGSDATLHILYYGR